MATWDVDQNLGHDVSLSILSLWRQFRKSETQVLTVPNRLYALPQYTEDRRTVDLKHELFAEILRGNYIAPQLVQSVLAPRNGPPPAILDIGTGTGSWAIAMAREFPHASVLGIDLIAPKPLEKVPFNCRFEVDDVNLSLDHYANCFDVVHARQIDAGIHDFQRFLNQVARILRPGGVILLVKGIHQLFSNMCKPLPKNEEGEPGFTFLQKIFATSYHSILERGGAVDAAFHYEDWLAQDPNYENCLTGTKDLFVPIGPWPPGLNEASVKACETTRMLFLLLIHSVRPLLGETPKPVIERWIAGAENELKYLSVQAYSKWRFAWAVRHSSPWVEHPIPNK